MLFLKKKKCSFYLTDITADFLLQTLAVMGEASVPFYQAISVLTSYRDAAHGG